MARRISDAQVLHLPKIMLNTFAEQRVPQRGVIEPLLGNIYLNEVNEMLERAREIIRRRQYTMAEIVRCANERLVLINAQPRNAWLAKAVDRRLREEGA